MSYDPKLDAMLALAISISTGDDSEGLEAVQNAEQNLARLARRLPREMMPSKEAFEATGFTFEDIGDTVLCQATLPAGWKLKKNDYYSTYFIDEKGRERGSYFYKGAPYDRYGFMSLKLKFYVGSDIADPENMEGPYTVSVKDVDDTILFTVGKCEHRFSDEYYELMKQGKEFLRTNYPEWENPSKYWD